MSEFFKPEDFDLSTPGISDHYKILATRAAAKANALLESRGVRVKTDDTFEKGPTKCTWYPEHYGTEKLTYTALLINIQPIAKPDSAEGLLKEWLQIRADAHDEMPADFRDIEKRAKKLLGEP